MADDENLSDQDAERLANFVARATTASDRMTRETTRLQEGHARLRQQFGDEAVREWYDEAQAFVTDQTSAAGGSAAAAVPPAKARCSRPRSSMAGAGGATGGGFETFDMR